MATIRICPGDNGRLIITFPYTPERVEKIKTISGRWRRPEEKHWTAPAAEWIVERLVSPFEGGAYEVVRVLY